MKLKNILGILLFISISSIIMGKELRIMTYNIYGGRLANGTKIGESIKRYAPDFISLQEVDLNTKRSNFRNVTQDIAKVLGYNFYYFQKARDFEGGEYGVSVISKYPVEKIYTYELPSKGIEKRQMLGVRFTTASFGKSVMIINSHMDYNNDIKTREVEEFLLATNSFEGDIKFISGDFNLLPTSAHYAKIIKDWKDSYFPSGALLDNPEYQQRELGVPRIDYIMGDKSDNWELKESYFINDDTQEWTKISDHLPYMGVFNIK